MSILRQWFDEVWNQGRESAIDAAPYLPSRMVGLEER